MKHSKQQLCTETLQVIRLVQDVVLACSYETDSRTKNQSWAEQIQLKPNFGQI